MNDLENLLQNAATYSYNTLLTLFKKYTRDPSTIVLVDYTLLRASIRDSLGEDHLPTDQIMLSDYIVAYLSSNVIGFSERIAALIELSFSEFPGYIFTVRDLCENLGLPYEATKEQLLTLDNYRAVLDTLVSDNRKLIEKHMMYVRAHHEARAEKLRRTFAATGWRKVVYFGPYEDIIKEVFEEDDRFELEIIDFEANNRLFQMLFMDTKSGVEVFFDGISRPIRNVSDALNYTTADLLDVPFLNYIAGLGQGIYKPVSEITDPDVLYWELLPYYEHTDYNFLSTALKNLAFDTKRLVEDGEEAGEYDSGRAASAIVDEFLLPDEILDTYKQDIPDIEDKAASIIVGISTYNIPEKALADRIAELQEDDSVKHIIIAGEPLLTGAKKVSYVTLGDNYPATLNNIAREACSFKGFLHFNDCSDALAPRFYARLKEELNRDLSVDVWTLRTLCTKDLHIMHLPVIPCAQLASVLEANIYMSASALLISTEVFSNLLFDEEIKYNTQYEFLFRATVAGYNVEPTTNATLIHNYELGTGKHLKDKTNYTAYIEKVRSKHKEAYDFFSAAKQHVQDHIRRAENENANKDQAEAV